MAEHRHRQQILRVDDEDVKPAAPEDEQALLDAIIAAAVDCDVICLEDYAKGLLSELLCQAVIAAAKQAGKPVLVDPGRRADWSKFRGASVLTPNRAELEVGVERKLRDDELSTAAGELAARLEIDALIVTLGREGSLLVRGDGSSRRFPTRPRAVYDNTGAGDAVLAMLAVAVAAGATYEQAAPLANIAGGLEVSKFGCVPVAREEVERELQHGHDAARGKLRALPELLEELAVRRQRGETVVFTNGCFDLLHPGHVELLERARALGSLLVVGLNSDASVRRQNKGGDRPIRKQNDRVRMLAALEAVDYVVLFDEESVLPLVERICPDVLVKGSDYRADQVVGGEFVRRRGGRVELIDIVAGHGTTAEIERIRGAQPAESQ
ncbi:MAG: bifunctional heptose 7-phosphate kinase/heptose 1-phosphate adenyltransferase [Planctomycetota bacterium]|nr:MAG: bifunctional heptose 7-phosphate kinase/heptose 1-phosphate adenyltransferase [Planctomycetota bacterium]